MTSVLVIGLIAIAVYVWQDRRALDPDQFYLMPAPTLYVETGLNPFAQLPEKDTGQSMGVFFATDREPAGPDDDQRFYQNRRGHLLRMGLSEVELSNTRLSWPEFVQVSLSRDRGEQYTLRVRQATELGIAPGSLTLFDDPQVLQNELDGAQAFAEQVNAKLAASRRKDIYIYVHGYKVVFENPLIVATELWHFLGYDGAMLAYAWPSTPNVAAYFADLETTRHSARNLRCLLAFLAAETEAERIHVLGYSAGTGLVSGALNEIALMHSEDTPEELQARYRLENVVLVCSDVDRGIFGNQLADGIWKIPNQLVIYVSEIDSTLGMSEMFLGRRRLGRLMEGDTAPPRLVEFLRSQNRLCFIDVSAAENAGANNGHAYFHKSPWVSSDLLMLFYTSKAPEDRGLVRSDSEFLWRFPDDYPQRLRALGPKLTQAEASQAEESPSEELIEEEEKSDASRL